MSPAFEALLAGGLVVSTGAAGALGLVLRSTRRRAEEEQRRVRLRAEATVLETRRLAAADTDELRRRLEGHRLLLEAVLEETRELVERRLPAVIDTRARRYPGVVVPGVATELVRGNELEELHSRVLALVGEAVEVTEERIGRAARAGVRGTADETQALLVRLQDRIDRELEKDTGGGPHVQGLSDIDHLTTMALHMVQRLRILAGSWPGLQRADCTVREIIESARGRIGDYRRVDYTYQPDIGEQLVEGRVVEPITVALAELLGNATAYSGDRVPVHARWVPKGFRIVVEDSGAGMNAFQLDYAERWLSAPDTTLDVTALEDERRLGFAVVGRLARDYGFRVDVSAPSSSGGVKAVVFVPHHLLAEPARSTSASPLFSSPPPTAPLA
ncbi:histidine kinase, partial [Streptomyces alkaliphilus]